MNDQHIYTAKKQSAGLKQVRFSKVSYRMKHTFICLLCSILLSFSTVAQDFISVNKTAGDFPVVSTAAASPVYVDANDAWLVQKAATLLQNDIEMVSGKKPALMTTLPSSAKNLIIIGTLDGSAVIRKLIQLKKMNVDDISHQREAFKLQTISHPFKGIENALVIVGNDKRGAAYATFTLSQQLGVSPWYWWADVPVKHTTAAYVKKGIYSYASPSVKYRGIFINDEAPAFSGWAKEKFGGVNHVLYEHMFELLLRLKANYLWPAMWGNAFNDDDTLNPVLADKWGIVMGTSHHEPMLRAQQEWKRYGKGPWDYVKNDSTLRSFWRKGIEHMGHHESVITIGMRGDGDEPMTNGTAINLLEKIVADQRKIIADVTGKPATETPQLWALYKEVQDYYDQGMRVPDDVTLLLCDDNWGNIRRLPRPDEKPRKGGYGIYYHFDYVGGPRNYKWINTNNIARVWEQMHLAYEHNVKDIWIVNVGDLKPMEFPISFFLDYAWNVHRWNEANLNDYYVQWAARQFRDEHAEAIAAILKKYAQYAARKKPELLDTKTYSIENYNEAERITNDWNSLLALAEKTGSMLPAEYKDAYFELVLHPVKAYANLQNLYTAVAWNHWYASQNNPLANQYAAAAKKLYANDSLITLEYNQLNNGKWNHMMDQKHIGYTYWQEPRVQKMPAVKWVTDSADAIITITDTTVKTAKNLLPEKVHSNVFYEQAKYVSIEASNYSAKKETPAIKWKIIPNIGKDGDGITSFPVTASIQNINANTPYLAYEFYTYDTGTFKLNACFSPTLNFYGDSSGLQYAISIDDEQPQIISINNSKVDSRAWSQWVSNNIIIKTSQHSIHKTGRHTLHYRVLSPGIILQKIMLDFGGLKTSYLGPPETIFKLKNN